MENEKVALAISEYLHSLDVCQSLAYYMARGLSVDLARVSVDAQQSAEKLNLFSECANCEYNPCDLRNNLDYCPAQERRIKDGFNPAIISG